MLFTTVRKLTGLEAAAIVCIDIDSETFSNSKECSVFYVGTSRAMAYLGLITTSHPEQLVASTSGDDTVRRCLQAIKITRDSLKVRIASENDLR